MRSTTKQVHGYKNAAGAMRGLHSRSTVRRRFVALDVVEIVSGSLDFKTRRPAWAFLDRLRQARCDGVGIDSASNTPLA